MSTALALTKPHHYALALRSGVAVAQNDHEAPSQGVAPTSPAFVYGDSTPFPYRCNFIHMIEAAVKLSVGLFRAQHALGLTVARDEEIERLRNREQSALRDMAASVRLALEKSARGVDRTDRMGRAAARILQASAIATQAAIATCDSEAAAELRKETTAREEARAAVVKTIEGFARGHDIPGSQLSLRLCVRSTGYDVQTSISTPCGLDTVFDVDLPSGHPWSTLRRVADLTPTLNVTVPGSAGWFKKPMTSLRLGRLTIRRICWTPTLCSVSLGRGPSGDREYTLSFDPRADDTPVIFREACDGRDVPPSFELGKEDAARVHEFKARLAPVMRDLSSRRVGMTRATFQGGALENHEPGAIASAVILALAQTTREIARRSGTPGELVLRSDAGARRRDEVYITKAELMEWIFTLPPALRGAFEPLELNGPRSPRAPAPSMPSYEEVGNSEIVTLVVL